MEDFPETTNPEGGIIRITVDFLSPNGHGGQRFGYTQVWHNRSRPYLLSIVSRMLFEMKQDLAKAWEEGEPAWLDKSEFDPSPKTGPRR